MNLPVQLFLSTSACLLASWILNYFLKTNDWYQVAIFLGLALGLNTCHVDLKSECLKCVNSASIARNVLVALTLLLTFLSTQFPVFYKTSAFSCLLLLTFSVLDQDVLAFAGTLPLFLWTCVHAFRNAKDFGKWNSTTVASSNGIRSEHECSSEVSSAATSNRQPDIPESGFGT